MTALTACSTAGALRRVWSQASSSPPRPWAIALRGAEHARVGAAKAVDALLGVAHDEDAGRVQPAAAGAGVARQPGVQRLPLQRVGVLELVDQQMAHARVQALLHVAAEEFVRQQGERARVRRRPGRPSRARA
jgi:hypothetical protein